MNWMGAIMSQSKRLYEKKRLKNKIIIIIMKLIQTKPTTKKLKKLTKGSKKSSLKKLALIEERDISIE